MTRGKVIVLAVLVGAVGLAVAMVAPKWLGNGKDLDRSLPLIGERNGDHLDSLPEFLLPDLTGQEIPSSSWSGKVLVLNFWATWCPPCLKEMPLLMEMQQAHADAGLQVVGIAIDTKEDVERFLADHPVNYPVLLGDVSAIEMSRRLGNRLQGLPFTIIVDRNGKRVHSRIGEVTRDYLTEQIGPLLPERTETQTAGN